MGTKGEDKAPKPLPKLVKLNNALKLAEQWVQKMSGDAEEDAREPETDVESRPPGLGLGARVLPKAQVRLSNDPLERKLQKKLNVGRRKAVEDERSTLSAKNEVKEDSDNENEDSRTNAFMAKKRGPPQTPVSQAKKKPK